MKQLIKLISILLILSFICISCSKSIPKCTDKDVLELSKELVLKVITANVVKNAFLAAGLYNDAAMVTMNTYQDYIIFYKIIYLINNIKRYNFCLN